MSKVQTLLFAVLSTALLFSSVYTHASSNVALKTCKEYRYQVSHQLQTNKQLNCHFSGLRWSTNLDGHESWCNQAGIAVAKVELQARKKSLQSCKALGFKLQIPDMGSALKDFVPDGWEVITKKSYQQTGQPSTVMPPIDDVIHHDITKDGKLDVITIIGKRTENKLLFERFALLILEKQANGLKRILVKETGIVDEKPPGVFPIAPKTSFTASPGFLDVRYYSLFDNNNKESSTLYRFEYQDGKMLLREYSDMYMYVSYGAVPGNYTSRTSYNFKEKTKTKYDDSNRDVSECAEQTKKCPEPIKKVEKLIPNSVPEITIHDFDSFEPVDLLKRFNMKIQ